MLSRRTHRIRAFTFRAVRLEKWLCENPCHPALAAIVLPAFRSFTTILNVALSGADTPRGHFRAAAARTMSRMSNFRPPAGGFPTRGILTVGRFGCGTGIGPAGEGVIGASGNPRPGFILAGGFL